MADELDDIREKEEANYQTSLKILGDSVSLVHDLLDVHALITTTAARSRLILKPEHYVTLHLSLAARYHLTVGSLAALRAHPTDAVRNGRMAIECAALLSDDTLKVADSNEFEPVTQGCWATHAGLKILLCIPGRSDVIRDAHWSSR
jgi:hypothetical protein